MSMIQTYIDDVHDKIDNYSNTRETLATLDKTFITNETADITLNKSTDNFLISTQKETLALNETTNNWDLSAINGFEFEDTSYDTTLTPSATTGNITLTLGTGSFSADDVGKTISGNGGICILTATDGSAVTSVDFTDTSAIASGSWTMKGVIQDINNLTLSGVTQTNDFSTMPYTNETLAVIGSFTGGIAFKSDGTKLFVFPDSSSTIYEYTLTTPWKLSSGGATTASKALTIPSTSHSGLVFKSDGTSFWTMRNNSSGLYQWNMSTAWDITTATTGPTTTSMGTTVDLVISSDGTTVVKYHSGGFITAGTMSTAWDISTLVEGTEYNVGAIDAAYGGTARGFTISSDGKTLIVSTDSGPKFYIFTTPTAYDFANLSYSHSISISEDTFGGKLAFKNDESSLYMLGESTDDVFEYSTGGSFIVPTSSAITNSAGKINTDYWTNIDSLTTTETLNDGTINYALSTDNRSTWKVMKNGETDRNIVKNDAGTWKYNDTTGEVESGYDFNFAISSLLGTDLDYFTDYEAEISPTIFQISHDGTKAFYGGTSKDRIRGYSLSIPYDITSTKAPLGAYNLPTIRSACFNNDGTRFYATSGADIKQFSCTNYDLSNLTPLADYTPSRPDTYSISTMQFSGNGLYFVYGTNNPSTASVYVVQLSEAYNLDTAGAIVYTFATGLAWRKFHITEDGTKIYLAANGSIRQYTVSPAYNINNASFNTTYTTVVGDPQGFSIANDGKEIYIITNYDGVNQYDMSYMSSPTYVTDENWTASTTNTEFKALEEAMTIDNNKMPKTQLDTITTANLPMNVDLDLAVIMETTGISPEFTSMNIQYDAQSTNKSAINSVDYEAKLIDADTVQFKALKNENFKIRIL